MATFKNWRFSSGLVIPEIVVTSRVPGLKVEGCTDITFPALSVAKAEDCTLESFKIFPVTFKGKDLLPIVFGIR